MMRLNRTDAQFRDRDRLGATGKGSIQDRACLHLWQELVGKFQCMYIFVNLLLTNMIYTM